MVGAGAVALGDTQPDWKSEEQPTAHQMVYLVTFSALLPHEEHAGGGRLRDLEPLTRVQIRDAVLDAVANPERTGGRPRTTALRPVKMAVFMETHAHGGKHFHVAMKLSSNTRWLALKLALAKRSRLASHWSSSHSMFWSAVRYGAFATEKKPHLDSDPLTWTADGSTLCLYEESQEPFNAAAIKARREKRERDAEGLARPTDAKKAYRFGKLDLLAVIIDQKLETPAQVMCYAQTKASTSVQSFVVKNQRRLQEYVDDAQAWAVAQEAVEHEKMSDVGP